MSEYESIVLQRGHKPRGAMLAHPVLNNQTKGLSVFDYRFQLKTYKKDDDITARWQDPDTISDEMLCEWLKEGRESAGRSLMERYEGLAIRMARKHRITDWYPQERKVMAETLIWQAIQTYRPDKGTKLITWVYMKVNFGMIQESRNGSRRNLQDWHTGERIPVSSFDRKHTDGANSHVWYYKDDENQLFVERESRYEAFASLLDDDKKRILTKLLPLRYVALTLQEIDHLEQMQQCAAMFWDVPNRIADAGKEDVRHRRAWVISQSKMDDGSAEILNGLSGSEIQMLIDAMPRKESVILRKIWSGMAPGDICKSIHIHMKEFLQTRKDICVMIQAIPTPITEQVILSIKLQRRADQLAEGKKRHYEKNRETMIRRARQFGAKFAINVTEKRVINWVSIRQELATGEFAMRTIAEKHGVSQPAISMKARKEGWTYASPVRKKKRKLKLCA